MQIKKVIWQKQNYDYRLKIWMDVDRLGSLVELLARWRVRGRHKKREFNLKIPTRQKQNRNGRFSLKTFS